MNMMNRLTGQLEPTTIDQCIFCGSERVNYFCNDENSRMGRVRDFYRCSNCFLIFTHPDQRLSANEELNRYEQHENDPSDPDYRNFLRQTFDPLNEKLAPGSKGLDFGSGPGPTLSVMLEEAGHDVDLYDIFFSDHRHVFDNQYDFITTTETVEHLFHPRFELERLWDCLKPGGWLAIMTRLVPKGSDPVEQFINWHYKNDDTHVVFYCVETFRWLGRQWKAKLDFYPGDVMLFQKPHE